LRLTLLVLGLSGFGTLGQVLMTRAYVHGEATTVSTVGYAGVALSMLVDWTLWDVAPGPSMYLGAALMGSAALVLVRGERPRPQ
jgi:drug/metabolite transporter (DMT)-like permease